MGEQRGAGAAVAVLAVGLPLAMAAPALAWPAWSAPPLGVARVLQSLSRRVAAPILAGLPASQRPEPARLWRMLQDARRRGFATESGENQPGVACLGVPVLRGISAVAAISVTAPAERMTAERCDELAGVVGELVPRFLPSGLTIPPLGGN